MMVLTVSEKKKLVFYILNLLFIIPIMISRFSLLYGSLSIALLGFLYYFEFNKKNDLDGHQFIMLSLFIDFLIYIILSWNYLKPGFSDGESINNMILNTENSSFVFLIIIALGFMIFKKGKTVSGGIWSTAIASFVAIFCSCIRHYTNASFSDFAFLNKNCEAIFYMFIFIIMLWQSFYVMTAIIGNDESRKMNKLLNIVFTIFLLVLIVTQNQLFFSSINDKLVAKTVSEFLINIGSGPLILWKVIVAIIIVISLIVYLYEINDDKLDNHIVFLIMFIGTLIIVKLLTNNYIPFFGGVYFSYIFINYKIVSAINKYDQKDSDNMESLLKLFGICFVCFVGAILFLEKGYILAVLSFIFTVLFLYKVFSDKLYTRYIRLQLIIICIMLNAFALTWSICSHFQVYLVIATIAFVGLSVLYVLEYKHPHNVKPSLVYHTIIISLVFIASFMPLRKYGIDIVSTSADTKNVSYTLENKGVTKEHITMYKWIGSDDIQNSNKDIAKNNKFSVKIQSRILVIESTDEMGIVSRKISFFPISKTVNKSGKTK